MLMASEGAKVVVVDPGSELDGSGGSVAIADGVVDEIRASGGEAVACYESVATMEGGEAIVQSALDSFGKLDIVVTCAGIPPRPHDLQHDGRRVGRGDPGPLEGHILRGQIRQHPLPPAAVGTHYHLQLNLRPHRQLRPVQLRRRQGRNRRSDASRRPRPGTLRRHGQLNRAQRSDPHDRRCAQHQPGSFAPPRASPARAAAHWSATPTTSPPL